MKSLARSGSTGDQVSPPTLRAEPTMTPSATARTSATVSCLTPVLASTGVVGSARFTASRSLMAAGSPVIAPETRTASGTEETTAERARSGRLRRIERVGELG